MKLTDEQDDALRRIRLKMLALYYQAKESSTASADELLEMQMANAALSDYGTDESDRRGEWCDDISIIAQEWSEQYDHGKENSQEFMKRICDVIGTTYGGDS